MPEPPASRPDSAPELLVGSLIGDRYRVNALIDEGAMGRVYMGEHIHMRKRVALKILRPELTRVPEVMARFEREAMAAAHIAHPNVATATDFGKLTDGSVYLVLEFVEGRTLRTEIEKGPLPLRRALSIALQISEALGAAHALGIVHRDLKPENVMLVDRDDGQDVVKVLDFGVAKVPVDIAESRPLQSHPDGALTTKAGMVFGTPDYMSPEQALGQTVDGRADMYSLGIVLYELLAGKRPFRAEHDFGILGQQLAGVIPPIAERAPGVRVPAVVEQLIGALLVNEVARRIGSAEELSQRLRDLLTLDLQDGVSFVANASGEVVDGVGQTLPAPASAEATRLSLARQGWFARLRAALRAGRLPDWEVIGVVVALLLVLVAGVTLYVSFIHKPATSSSALPVGSVGPIAASHHAPDVVNSGLGAPGVSAPAASVALENEALTDEQLEGALQAGPLAVDALLQRYPKDGRAHLAQARAAFKLKQWSSALASTKTALALDLKLNTNKHVATILWRLAQLTETKDETLAVLQGAMRSKGADILYDLAITRGVRQDVATAAATWLDTKGFDRVSTPEASVAAALFRARNCKVRQALVKRAENVGDHRSLAQLDQFAEGKGCKENEKGPCNACLKNSPEIAQARAAIRARQTQRKP